MARAPSATVDDLLALLASGDAVPAAQIVQALQVTRPVLSRLVREAGPQVLRVGQGRSTRYVARATSDAGSEWPLWRMRADASVEELGTLHLLRGEQFQYLPIGEQPNLMRAVGDAQGHFPGLPWFLDDLRPQGFLGRNLAHRRGGELRVPTDLNRWQLGDAMLAISRTGGTGIGDLLLGPQALSLALAEREHPADAVLADARPHAYSAWADDALEGEEVGSSPGGEQPKFTSTVVDGEQRYATLVKFALREDSTTAGRWADLLVCEQLAAACLLAAGLSAVHSTLVWADRHLCLEVQRFDRTRDTLGRQGFVSLLALETTFIGSGDRDWGVAGERLAALGLIDRNTARQMSVLHWFGRLIGNVDMHLGNLGFHLREAGPLPLTPAYDMLPMYLAPSRTGHVRSPAPLQIAPPTRVGQAAHIAVAADAAIRFWTQVADADALQSSALRDTARQNREVVGNYAKAFARG